MSRDARVRVVQILYSGLGGHGSVAFSLIESDREGRYAHGLLFFGVEPARAEYEEKASLHRVSHRSVLKRPGFETRSSRELYAALADLKPDVILNHSPAAILPVGLYARRHSVPLVTVEHQANAAKTWKHHLWSKLSLMLSRSVVVLTDDYLREYESLHGSVVRNADVRVIGNGIDTDLFSPAATMALSGTWHVGMASRLTPLRDHVGLVQALAMTERSDVKLLIAGAGDTEPRIQSEISRLDLSERVCMCGLLDEEHMVSFLQGLDVYVHASFFETMSTSIMQAMSVGLPVVAYDIPGVRNLVQPGVTGLLVPPGRPELLAKTLARVVEDSALRNRLGSRARRFARDNWSLDKMFSRYNDLLASNSR